MTIQPVIFNYNLPDQTDEIYDHLVQCGFDEKSILVVDNGSDKATKPKSTNLALPFNIRFSGQANITLNLLMTYRPSPYYLLITTSAELEATLNYKQICQRIIDENSSSFGVVMASLIGGETAKISPQQSHEYLRQNDIAYCTLYSAQPIMTLISHELLLICQKNNAAYFNIQLIRGHGIDIELQHMALTHGLMTYVSRDLWVYWKTNQVHKLQLADESAEEYRCQAQAEMEQCFAIKYGDHWEQQFRAHFINKDLDLLQKKVKFYKSARLRGLWYRIKYCALFIKKHTRLFGWK